MPEEVLMKRTSSPDWSSGCIYSTKRWGGIMEVETSARCFMAWKKAALSYPSGARQRCSWPLME